MLVNGKTRNGGYIQYVTKSARKKEEAVQSIFEDVGKKRSKKFKLFMSTLNHKLFWTNNYNNDSGAIEEVNSLCNHVLWMML